MLRDARKADLVKQRWRRPFMAGNRDLTASAATQEAQTALPQRQLDHPLEAHPSEPRLGHPLPGRRLQSNRPRGDFVHDKLSNGRAYKMLTVLDEFTRQALAVVARTKMGADDVLEALYPLLLHHGYPEYIRSDNGPEFAAEAMQGWLRRVGIKPIRIYPGSPWENGYNERFNGTLRREVLNAEWFTTTKQAP
ncbi:MAG: DDE-type integrase/transposase/recombinase, partial [Pseudomonadota bacterium]